MTTSSPYDLCFQVLLDPEHDGDFPAKHEAVLSALEKAGFKTHAHMLLWEAASLYAHEKGVAPKEDIKLLIKHLDTRIKRGEDFLNTLGPLPGNLHTWADMYAEDIDTPSLAKTVSAYLSWARKALASIKSLPVSKGKKPDQALNEFLVELIRIWREQKEEPPTAWIQNAGEGRPGGNILPLASGCLACLVTQDISDTALAQRIKRLR